jgi:hypothetical protein
MESSLKFSPIYYAPECGLEPTFADSGASLWLPILDEAGTFVGSSLRAELSVHQVSSPSVYLTTGLYGYDPADWGTIKQTISISDYMFAINTGKPVSTGKPVNLEVIHGSVVRHILPFTSGTYGRPCGDQSREQYQWINGKLLFNLVFTETPGEPSSAQRKAEILDSIFSSLKLD